MLTAGMLWSTTALGQTHPVVAGMPTDHHGAVVGIGMELGEARIIACTGTLITPRLVLTAAHCGADLDLEVAVDVGAVFFGQSSDDTDEIIGLSQAWIHPEKDGLDYDLALVELEEDAPVRPSAIWLGPIDDDFVDTELTVVGWGQSSEASHSGGTKRVGTLVIDKISDLFLISFQDTNPDGALPCDGDSGGPLYLWSGDDWVQVGVHSWGEARCGERSGSTRIDIATEWIADVVGEVHGSPDLCEINGQYGDGTCDASCPLVDEDCADAQTKQDCGCHTSPRQVPAGWGIMAGLWALGRRRWATPRSDRLSA